MGRFWIYLKAAQKYWMWAVREESKITTQGLCPYVLHKDGITTDQDTVTATNVAGLEVRNSVQFGQVGFEIYIRHSNGINKLIVGYLNLALVERAKDINLRVTGK